MSVERFNTGETLEDLKKKYNSEGSILRKAQLRMLDMLLYLDKVCSEQNISYRIDAGNVLGAIRHGGFIPWDDDIDIVLSRKDYKKLLKYLMKNPHIQYKLQSFKTDSGYVGAWAVLRDIKSEYIQDCKVHNARKYRGLQIDIFPYENRVIKCFYKLSGFITSLNRRLFVGNCMPIARIIYIFQFYILHPVFRLIGLWGGDKHVYMHSYGSLFKVQHSSEALFPFKVIEFEGYKFWGPAKPNLYCKEHYGENYMDLPLEENRDHHKATYKIWD